MKGLVIWLNTQNGPVLQAGAAKAFLVLTSALIAAKILPQWVENVGALLVQLLAWI